MSLFPCWQEPGARRWPLAPLSFRPRMLSQPPLRFRVVMVPHLFPLKLCPGSPGHGRSSRPKKISMEREKRDEFGGVKRPPLRNTSSSATYAPFFLFTSRGWRRAWAVGSALVKPKIEEFRHGSDLTLKINKRFKTSFTGTSHKKSFYILVSKDKEKKEMGEGQNSKLGP